MKTKLLFCCLLSLGILFSSASAYWWNDSWQRKSIVSITDYSNHTRSDEIISFDMASISGFYRSDVKDICEDIRVIDYVSRTEKGFTKIACNSTSVVLSFSCDVPSASPCADIYWKNPSAMAPATLNISIVAGSAERQEWWNNSWRMRYNVTLDLLNMSRTTTNILWNFTVLGIKAVNCTKELRLIADTNVEIPSWSYNQENNGTDKNCFISALVNQTSKTKSYWIYSDNPSADVPAYTDPFVIFGGSGLGSTQGSIDNGAGFNVTWGRSSGLGGDNRAGFSPKIDGIDYWNPTDGNMGQLFMLDSTRFPSSTNCNVTGRNPIFVELTCWGTSGWYARTYYYRNLPQVDFVMFNGTKTDAGLTYDIYGIVPDLNAGGYNIRDADSLSSGDSETSVLTTNPASYVGFYPSLSTGKPNYHLLLEEFKSPEASNTYYFVGSAGASHMQVGRRDSGPTGSGVAGWKIRYVFIPNTTAVSHSGFAGLANVQNVTYNVPIVTMIGT